MLVKCLILAAMFYLLGILTVLEIQNNKKILPAFNPKACFSY